MQESKQLRDTFANPASRCQRTVLVIDIVDSTAMKEQQPQATWLSSFGWFYDMFREIADEAVPNGVIKYLGDGIMWVVDTDHTTAAVNAVIQMQEAIDKAGPDSSGAKGVIDFTCSVGVSTGAVVEFATEGEAPDFIGTVVDKAFRLCSAASAKAIFVDTPTVGAANMIRIDSKISRALDRTTDQFQGEVQRAVVKGFDQPVAYHELFWALQRYGVKSSTVTDSTDRLRTAPPPAPVRLLTVAGSSGAAKVERHRGEVTFSHPEKDFGFARDPDTGEEFHVAAKQLIYPDDAPKLVRGRKIAFVASGVAADGKHREAGAVLIVGEPADGPLVNVHPNRNNGWIRVEDASGNSHMVYVSARELAGYQKGDILGFTVDVNDKGAYARQVEQVADDGDLAAA